MKIIPVLSIVNVRKKSSHEFHLISLRNKLVKLVEFVAGLFYDLCF